MQVHIAQVQHLVFLCSFFLMLVSLGIATSITTVRLVSHHHFISLDLEFPQDLSLVILKHL